LITYFRRVTENNVTSQNPSNQPNNSVLSALMVYDNQKKN